MLLNFIYFNMLILCIWLQVINKVKDTHQGEGCIKVKVNYLHPFKFYVAHTLCKRVVCIRLNSFLLYIFACSCMQKWPSLRLSAFQFEKSVNPKKAVFRPSDSECMEAKISFDVAIYSLIFVSVLWSFSLSLLLFVVVNRSLVCYLSMIEICSDETDILVAFK